MGSPSVELSYDADENILFMSFARPVRLDTREEITEHFDRVVAFWRARTCSKKAYFVVDFDNIDINVAELDHYAQQSKIAHEICAIASVRYGGSPLQRTTARLAGMKIHRPSNIYETREQALAVVRTLKKKAGNASPPSGGRSSRMLKD
jgi:hypothetical protein